MKSMKIIKIIETDLIKPSISQSTNAMRKYGFAFKQLDLLTSVKKNNNNQDRISKEKQ